jgi:hypothetical protein
MNLWPCGELIGGAPPANRTVRRGLQDRARGREAPAAAAGRRRGGGHRIGRRSQVSRTPSARVAQLIRPRSAAGVRSCWPRSCGAAATRGRLDLRPSRVVARRLRGQPDEGLSRERRDSNPPPPVTGRSWSFSDKWEWAGISGMSRSLRRRLAELTGCLRPATSETCAGTKERRPPGWRPALRANSRAHAGSRALRLATLAFTSRRQRLRERRARMSALDARYAR